MEDFNTYFKKKYGSGILKEYWILAYFRKTGKTKLDISNIPNIFDKLVIEEYINWSNSNGYSDITYVEKIID